MQQYTHENVRSIPHLPIYCDRYEDYRQFSPRHWHDHIEIIYVVSGSLQVVCGENEYTLQENEFFVINSNKIHGTQSYERVKVLLVQIPYVYLDSYIDDYRHIRFRECYETEHGSRKYEQMKSLLKSIAHIYRKKGKGYELRLMVDIVFKDVEGVPTYKFDFPTMLISLACFITIYEIMMYIYSEKIKKISIKEIMIE